MLFRSGFTIFILLVSGFSLAAGPDSPNRPGFETEQFRLRLSARTPDQIAAFYTGRGFPQFAIDELRRLCFITVGLHNKSDDTVWLDVGNWRFHTDEGELKRFERRYWKKYWAEHGLEKRFQSTFRWTLIPEQLDFHPGEGEGGNIILPRTDKPITLTAAITVGKHKSKVYDIKIDNLLCATDK